MYENGYFDNMLGLWITRDVLLRSLWWETQAENIRG
jgi:hypothetical protein